MEIDESKCGQRKYNRGYWQEDQGVFGVVEWITGKSLLVEVQQRDANTVLLNMLRKLHICVLYSIHICHVIPFCA